MDRYPADPQAREKPSGEVAPGTHTSTGRGTGAASLEPHLYKYLVDDIQIAAGLLAEVDVEWAQRMFMGYPAWTSDEDIEWNEYLAKLGHALHAVEDYFVHSNFLELALSDPRWPEGANYLPKKVAGKLKDSAWEIVQKRLRRFDGEHAANAEIETRVVTGYFDFCDTLFSLRHVQEEALGAKKPAEVDAAEPWRKLLRNTVVQVQDASKAPLTDEQSRLLAFHALTIQATNGDPDIREAALEVLNGVPVEVRDAFLDSVVALSRRTVGAISLYDAFETVYHLTKLVTSPLQWLAEKFPWLAKLLEELYEDEYEDRVQQIVDARRAAPDWVPLALSKGLCMERKGP